MSIKVIDLFNLISSLNQDIHELNAIYQSMNSEGEHFERIKNQISEEITELENKKKEILKIEIDSNQVQIPINPQEPANNRPTIIEPKNLEEFKREKTGNSSSEVQKEIPKITKKSQKHIYRY